MEAQPCTGARKRRLTGALALAAVTSLVAATPALGGDNQEITVTPSTLFDGITIPVGTQAIETVEVKNGPASINLSVSQPTFGGAAPGDYSITNDGCAPYPKNLSFGQSCTFDVLFTAMEVGARNAAVNIPSNDADEPISTVALVGEGEPAPIADLTIAKPGGPVLGQDVYEVIPDEQVLKADVKRGRSKTYIVNFGNDNGSAAGIAVLGCADEKGFKVSYVDGPSQDDVTSQVVFGQWAAEVGSDGRDLELHVKAKKSARGRLKCNVTGSSPGSADDSVQLSLRAKN